MSKYHCNYCDEDIEDVRVKCTECGDFDLCLQCFSCGAEIGHHRNSHGYQLIDCGMFQIFNAPDAWCASDEMALLEAVEMYGFGNWEDTATFIGKRSPEQVRDYFITYYIDGMIGKASWSAVEDIYQIKDDTCPREGPLSPSLTTPLPAIPDLSQAEQQHLGYLPQRDDFERELDNEAESLISTLAISNEDEDIDIELKLAHVDMYRRRLAERFRIKAIVRDYGLVGQFYKYLTADEDFMRTVTLVPSLLPTPPPMDEDTNLSTSSISSKSSNAARKKQPPSSPVKIEPGTDVKPSTPQAKDVYAEKFKIFSQFQSALDQKNMFDGLRREKELKARIRELVRYRRNGLKKYSEVPGFEDARLNRDKRKENKKKGSSSTLSDRKGGSSVTDTARSSPVSTRSAKDPSNGSAASRLSPDLTDEAQRLRQSPLRSERLAASRYGQQSPGSPSNDLQRTKRGSGDDQGSPGDHHGPKRARTPSGQSDEFDIESMPLARLLSPNEKKLCASLRLKPSQYIQYKGVIIQEIHIKRPQKKAGTPQKSALDTMDKNIKKRLFTFMARSGWLAQPSTA